MIVFCNVGEGDGILVKEGLKEAVIDAGPANGKMKQCLDKFLPFFDREIEVVFASHYDADHIGGFAQIFADFKPKKVFGLAKTTKETKTFRNWQQGLRKLGVRQEAALAGQVVHLDSWYFEVLYPFFNSDYSVRNLSLVLKLHAFKTFLLGGDLENPQWQELIHKHIFLESDILKISHHGSRNGTSKELLEVVRPKEAVISVGKNRYGHPHQEVLDLLRQLKIKVRRTDREGDIVFSPLREWVSISELEKR